MLQRYKPVPPRPNRPARERYFPGMRLKVLTYNLLYGGRDGDSDRRARAQAGLIAELAPDICLLQEAKGFETGGGARLHALEERLGMRGFLALAPATEGHIAILLRPPLLPVSFVADAARFHHVLATLEVKTPGGRILAVMGAHLCPYGVAVRRQEAAYLAARANPGAWSLLAGDLNAVSPHAQEPEGFDRLPVHHRVRHLAEGSAGMDRSVLAFLEAGGWIDLGHALGGEAEAPTVPTAGFREAEFPITRFDYILASRPLAACAKGYRVVRTAACDTASDHYPVLAEFELPD